MLRNRELHTWLLFLSCVGLLSACAGLKDKGVDASTAFRIDSLRQEFVLPKTVSTLRIENEFGEINVRKMPKLSVGTITATQRFGAQAALPEINWFIEGHIATLTVRYPDKAPAHDAFDGNPGRADLAVYVPDLAHLALASNQGRIQVKRYSGSVTAKSTSGALLISARGALNLTTQSGDILAMHIAPKWTGSSHIVSQSGLVNVVIPELVTAQIDASASSTLDIQLGERFSATKATDNSTSGYMGDPSVAANRIFISGRDVHLRKLVLL